MPRHVALPRAYVHPHVDTALLRAIRQWQPIRTIRWSDVSRASLAGAIRLTMAIPTATMVIHTIMAIPTVIAIRNHMFMTA